MYTARGKTDKNTLVQQHLPLVKKVAGILKSRLPSNVEVDDLIQAGTIGLLDAINNYQISHQTQFETYASLRIKGAMIDELRSMDWAPRGVRQQMRTIEETISKLRHQLGRNPNENEVAKQLNMPLAEYQLLLGDGAGHQLLYIEDLTGDESAEGFLDRYESSENDDPLRELLSTNFRSDLIEAIEDLPEREKTLMSLYYEHELNLREIGEVLGVTESRVCQLHSQAISRVRATLKEKLWSGAV